MSRIVFLVEEFSMKVFLEGLMPRLFPGIHFLCIHHEGKQDLERSIPRKLRAWTNPGDKFIVIRDNDCSDCYDLKDRLIRLCPNHNRCNLLVRIACQELEAWYFGEPQAIADAYNKAELSNINRRRRYREPDAITQPSKELERLVPEFQKVSGARKISEIISREGNNSRSFQVLCEGIERIMQEFQNKPLPENNNGGVV